MILTCPQCTMRYLLPATVLAPDGRNVKCSNCTEVWFEEPDYDELAEIEANKAADQADSEQDQDIAPEFDDIPEGVKPDIELDFVDREEEQAKQVDDEEGDSDALNLKPYIGSAIAASAVFFVILGGLITMKPTMVNAWPASAALYQMMGFEIAVPGEGLVFDRIKIESNGEIDGGEDFILSGQVINLTTHDQHLPMIEANLRDEKGDVVETWYVDMPEDIVPAESDLKFMQNYKASQSDTSELYLRFALKKKKGVKTVSKGDDNNHAQSSGDHALPSDDAKDQESHAPASAQHH